jgi:hypothetical protein
MSIGAEVLSVEIDVDQFDCDVIRFEFFISTASQLVKGRGRRGTKMTTKTAWVVTRKKYYLL